MTRFLFVAFLAAAVLGGCRTEPSEPATGVVTDAAWDALGAEVVASAAVAVQSVAAEPERYVGQTVTVEGIVGEVCQNSGCWLTLAVGPEEAPVRVDVPRDSTGAYVYTFPMDISGRRVIVTGTLAEGEDAAHEHGEGEDHGEAEEDVAHGETDTESHDETEAMTASLAIVAQGALVERIGD